MNTAEICDICGSASLLEIKCKVVCRNCGTILRSCSDLAEQQVTRSIAPSLLK